MRYLLIEDNRLEIQNYSDDFIILKDDNHQQLPQIARAIFEKKYPFIEDVIATEVEILIKLNRYYKSGYEKQLEQLTYSTNNQKRSINLPVYFGESADWNYIIEHTGLSSEDYLSQLQETTLTVAMYGFMPGFIYMKGLPTHMQVPRKENPEIKIPKNSLALGGPYTGIYSMSSPGGWRIIGQLATPIISIDTLPPVKLDIGDHINLVPISKGQLNSMTNKNITLEAYNGIS